MANIKVKSDNTARQITFDGKDKNHGCGNNLYLRVRPSSKTWIFITKRNGKRIVKTIGTFPEVNYKTAMRKALALKSDIGAELQSSKIKDLVQQYLDRVIFGTENKRGRPHRRGKENLHYWEFITKELGHLNIDSLNADHLEKLLRDFKASRRTDARGNGSRAADVLYSTLKTFLMHPTIARRITGKNPIEAVDRFVTGYKNKPRQRVLTDDEIHHIFTLDHKNANVLRFCLLTGLRISETRHGHQDGDFWIVPAEFSKNGVAHWVYLTDLAKAQLPLARQTDTNVQAWLKRYLTNLGYSDDERYTAHDLRRTFATRLNDYKRDTDEANTVGLVQPFIIEKCLNHKLDGVMAVYNQAEYRAQRIEAAKIMTQIINEIVNKKLDSEKNK